MAVSNEVIIVMIGLIFSYLVLYQKKQTTGRNGIYVLWNRTDEF